MTQLHTADYRNAGQLPEGAVLVVGGAQSGCQIAEDLARAGRRVYLSASRVGRYPGLYRGRELIGWLADCGFWDQRPVDLADPAEARLPFPVIASGGRSLDLGILAGLGVTLLGRLAVVAGERVRFAGSPAAYAAYADEVAAGLEAMADAYIEAHSIKAPPREPAPAAGLVPAHPPEDLDLAATDIGTVIWATGFTGDLSWAHLPLHAEAGTVLHDGCAAPVPGLWYVGFPWLTRRRSGIFYGLPADAADVVAGVVSHLARGA